MVKFFRNSYALIASNKITNMKNKCKYLSKAVKATTTTDNSNNIKHKLK